MNKGVFLDRDGVLNEVILRKGKPYPPLQMQDLKFIEGMREKLGSLKEKGFLLIGVTNQPDVKRGKAPRTVVEEINNSVKEEFGLDEMRACFHDDGDNCTCRKPKPGLIIESARSRDIDLRESFVVGDRWKDVEAGKRAGCKTIFIDCQYSERQPEGADIIVKSPIEALDFILNGGASS